MAFMEQRAEGFPSALGARASRHERQNAEKDAEKTAAADKAEKEKTRVAAIKQGRAEEKVAAKARGEDYGASPPPMTTTRSGPRVM